MRRIILGLVAAVGLLAINGKTMGQSADKPMAVEADPSFDVATIKPDPSGYPGMLGLGQTGRTFAARNVSLVEMVAFAYGVHPKEVLAGAQKWAQTDRYDIQGVPDKEGIPNVLQQRSMVKKMLEERFKLVVKSDQQEMSAYTITALKDGSKLKPTKMTGLNPLNDVRPSDDGWILSSQNASLRVLAGFLELAVLDRPVVDKTGLTERYDMVVDFTPDNSLFNGHPPPARQTSNPAPGLFDAIQQQLGLKLTAEKAMVEVWTVEKAEKPSAN